MIDNLLEDLSPLSLNINQTIENILSEDVTFFGQVGLYSFSGGGKRFRPLIYCLVYEVLEKEVDQNVLKKASSFELLHMSTLLHDDIVDKSSMRRGRPSAHTVFGIPETVLAGDYFLAKAADLMVVDCKKETVDILIKVIRELSLGELEQLKAYRKVTLEQKDYFHIIYRKTAVLIESVAKIAAIEAGVDGDKKNSFSEYGRATGLAFQIMDDILDYQSEKEVTGKPGGKDLEEGRITLPFILALENLGQADKKRLLELGSLEEMTEKEKKEVLGLVNLGLGIEKSLEKAEELAQQASDSLLLFPDSKAKERLCALAHYAARRTR
jgi:octaprenyl-diphosphate synthase